MADRSSCGVDGIAVDGFAVEGDEESWPQPGLLTVHVEPIIIAAPELEALLQPAAGDPLIVRGRADVEGQAVVAELLAFTDQLNARRGKRRIKPPQHLGCDGSGFRRVHRPYIEGFSKRGSVATKQAKMHGRVEGARARCAVPGCTAPGEYKAPLQPASFDGPGTWRFFCLDHVREYSARYNYFDGMSPDEIARAQSPLGGWERPSRKFAANGADPPPRWSDFADPLDAIATRFRMNRARAPSRFSRAEQRALSVLGLGEDADRHSVRQRYSLLVRRYHPDKNGGDRSHEGRLGEVIEAYQLLRKAAAFA